MANLDCAGALAFGQDLAQAAPKADGRSTTIPGNTLIWAVTPDKRPIRGSGKPDAALSHHLDKLKNEELVNVRREGTFLWYTANTEALQELLNFLYAECCTRSKAVKPGDLVLVVQASKGEQKRRSR
jgi:DNA-binding transcriptional ArsR family regulator